MKEVKAKSVVDFLDRYYKPNRFRGRGEEYANILIKSHTDFFNKWGDDIISRHDCVLGEAVKLIGLEGE